MTPLCEALLTDLAAGGVMLGADGDRVRYRPVAAVPAWLVFRVRKHRAELLELLRAAGWGPFTAAELLAYARGEEPARSETARDHYEERLGVATDLGLDTSPGSGAELTARAEADAVNTRPPSAWPGTHGASVIAHAAAVFGKPPRQNTEHSAFQSGHVQPLIEAGRAE